MPNCFWKAGKAVAVPAIPKSKPGEVLSQGLRSEERVGFALT